MRVAHWPGSRVEDAGWDVMLGVVARRIGRSCTPRPSADNEHGRERCLKPSS
jgi:hypothetical protein